MADIEALMTFLESMWIEKLPFNRVLGLEAVSLEKDRVCLRVDMREELVGNYIYGTLHGGVISAVLDAAGGMMAAAGVLHRMDGCSIEDAEQILTRLGTIDLRVDYLRPGKGRFYLAHSTMMRAGKKVAVTRMELYNDTEVLIAVGTGTYIVG